MNHATASRTLGCSLLLVASLAARAGHANECRAVATVQNSALVANNTGAGGHVTQHIHGVNAPPLLNQATKTLWTSAAEYTGAWNNYEARNGGVQCTGLGTKRETVSVQTLLHKPVIGAYSCAAGTVGGQCTQQTRTQCNDIQFDFIQVGGHWILQTAYPTNCG